MQIELKGWVYLDTLSSQYSATPRFTFFPGAKEDNIGGGVYVPVVEATVTAESPEFDPRTLQVAALRSEAKRVQAEAQKRLTDIESRIGKLLAIEHTEAA
jgi:hypothetical protein